MAQCVTRRHFSLSGSGRLLRHAVAGLVGVTRSVLGVSLPRAIEMCAVTQGLVVLVMVALGILFVGKPALGLNAAGGPITLLALVPFSAHARSQRCQRRSALARRTRSSASSTAAARGVCPLDLAFPSAASTLAASFVSMVFRACRSSPP